jgi:hypothetical protein
MASRVNREGKLANDPVPIQAKKPARLCRSSMRSMVRLTQHVGRRAAAIRSGVNAGATGPLYLSHRRRSETDCDQGKWMKYSRRPLSGVVL